MKTITNKNKVNENAEYGVDSRYTSIEERKKDYKAIVKARLERANKPSKEQIIRAKLLQLKLKMDSHLKAPVYNHQNHFTAFLETYIDTIYSKRNEFAKDINITPILLSQIINNHRDANEEFILKLIIHSEKVFENLGKFNKTIWYEIYFQDKIFATMSNQKEWRPKIEKQVKFNETF